MTSDMFFPGGAQEIPGADFGWITKQKAFEEPVSSGHDIDEVINEVRHALAEGENLEWMLVLALGGDPTGSATIKVVVPPDSEGGFAHQGANVSGNYTLEHFGASDYNTFVGTMRGGVAGALLGADIHTFWGLVRGGESGLMKFQLQTSSSLIKVLPGTMLRIRSIGA